MLFVTSQWRMWLQNDGEVWYILLLTSEWRVNLVHAVCDFTVTNVTSEWRGGLIHTITDLRMTDKFGTSCLWRQIEGKEAWYTLFVTSQWRMWLQDDGEVWYILLLTSEWRVSLVHAVCDVRLREGSLIHSVTSQWRISLAHYVCDVTMTDQFGTYCLWLRKDGSVWHILFAASQWRISLAHSVCSFTMTDQFGTYCLWLHNDGSVWHILFVTSQWRISLAHTVCGFTMADQFGTFCLWLHNEGEKASHMVLSTSKRGEISHVLFATLEWGRRRLVHAVKRKVTQPSASLLPAFSSLLICFKILSMWRHVAQRWTVLYHLHTSVSFHFLALKNWCPCQSDTVEKSLSFSHTQKLVSLPIRWIEESLKGPRPRKLCAREISKSSILFPDIIPMFFSAYTSMLPTQSS